LSAAFPSQTKGYFGLTRLTAILAAVAMLAGASASYAATGAPSTPNPPAPLARAQAKTTGLTRARSQALAAYRRARHVASLLGEHRGPPRGIEQARSVRRLHALRRHWAREARNLRRRVREDRATHAAVRQIGTRYTWGGASPRTGFDCSGLVMWAYSRVGVHLSHSSWSQMSSGRRVTRANMRRGDLVFEYGGGHVGIYLGHGVMLAATHPGGTVARSPLAEWQINAIRRVG
jgi:cell wall-associated NlpC family hydrolase